MVTASDFIKGVKNFLRMSDAVTLYDSEIETLINSALATLTVAGVELEKSPLVVEFVNCFVRVRMMTDAGDSFRNSELKRENIILQQLIYGG